MAEIVRDQWLKLGVVDADNLQKQLIVEQPSLHWLVLSALPRGKRFKPLVSKHGSYHTVLHALHVDKTH